MTIGNVYRFKIKTMIKDPAKSYVLMNALFLAILFMVLVFLA